MVIEILSYSNSFLNPLLKIITILMFVVGMYYFFKSRQKYGGELKRIANLLLWGGAAGFIASAFRYGGDFVMNWKWGESIFLLIFGLTSFFVAYLVRYRFIEAAKALGLMESD